MKMLRSDQVQLDSHREKAFTLIELLLVVAIIGILASVAVPRFFGRSQEARITAARQEIVGTLGLALDLYEQDMGHYPNQQEGLESLIEPPNSEDNWRGPYLKSRTVPLDSWGTPYEYVFPGQLNRSAIANTYDLISAGPDRALGTEDDITNYD